MANFSAVSTSFAAYNDSPHVVIIGGGITGLSAAWELERAQVPVRYTLLERDTRVGGKIATDRIGANSEFVVERGPDSFLTQKIGAWELVHELGLEDRVVPTNDAPRRTYVLVNGRPCPMPPGLSLLAPTQIGAFLRSPLLSPLGRLRMLMDWIIPKRADQGDETIAAFVTRRFGAEALDRIGEPLLGGIHSCEVEQQSLLATFPRFRAMEQQHGSLIRGSRAQIRRARQTIAPAVVPFVTLRGGISELTEALEQRLDAHILRGVGVVAVDYVDGGGYTLLLDDGATMYADAVVLATPAYVAADIVEGLQPELAAQLRGIRYVSTGSATLAYRASEIGTPLDGFGLVIPRSENRKINALTVTTRKFKHRAPDDHVLLRVFFGGADTPEAMQLDDAALVNTIQHELRSILGVTVAPVWSNVYRWWNSNPQYDLDHLKRVSEMEAACPPGLLLAGSAYRGVGIPDCVRQGRAAARQALAHTHTLPATVSASV